MLGAGVVLVLLLPALGVAAAGPLHAPSLRLDIALAAHRSAALVAAATGLTIAAQPAVGIAVGVLAPALLWLAGRRRRAIAVFAVIVAALGLGWLAKTAIHEPRPPAQLWAIAPDSLYSFPSGHATVAAAVTLAALVAVHRRRRVLVGVIGGLVTAAVGAARVYLGVHYLPDVLGGYLVVAAAAVLLAGLAWLPVARRCTDRLTLSRT